MQPQQNQVKSTQTAMSTQTRTATMPPQTQMKSTQTGMSTTQTRTATMQPQTQMRPAPTPAPVPVQPTPTPVPPPNIQAYLDRQLSNGKFKLTINGKDMMLTPFHTWRQKSTGANTTSTCVDMRSDEGRVYDIDFNTTGDKVSGIRVHRINGEIIR
jgi:hypothetical protein